MPKTPEEIYSRSDDIIQWLSWHPECDPGMVQWLAENPCCLYLFYKDNQLMAGIRLDDRSIDPLLGKGTTEIHGAINPDFRGLADEPTLFVLKLAFKTKKNILAKVDPDNKGARGFCWKWGFQKINRENGKLVYRLKRGDFMRRFGDV